MRFGERIRVYVRIVLAQLLIAAVASATSTKWERNTLKGVSGFYVVVSCLHQGDVAIDIDTGAVGSDIAQALTEAGIHVHDERQARDHGNILAVTISILRSELEVVQSANLYVYTVDLVVRQRVNLVRKRWVKCSAITWFSSQAGIAEADQTVDQIRDSVLYNLRKFLKDFREVNE